KSTLAGVASYRTQPRDRPARAAQPLLREWAPARDAAKAREFPRERAVDCYECPVRYETGNRRPRHRTTSSNSNRQSGHWTSHIMGHLPLVQPYAQQTAWPPLFDRLTASSEC